MRRRALRQRPERSAVPAGHRGQRPGLLAWTAPSSNGGSAITGYRVYRGTAPNPTVALTPDLGVVTSFLDTGRTNGQIYYYKVTALNAIGESVASNEANATPSAPASAPSAPQSLQATAGNAQVSLDLDCSLLERRLGHHRLPRVPGRPLPTRPSPSPPISAW